MELSLITDPVSQLFVGIRNGDTTIAVFTSVRDEFLEASFPYEFMTIQVPQWIDLMQEIPLFGIQRFSLPVRWSVLVLSTLVLDPYVVG